MAHDTGSNDSGDKAGEKLLGPESTVEAEGKFIEVALQILFIVGSQKKALQTKSSPETRKFLKRYNEYHKLNLQKHNFLQSVQVVVYSAD